MNYLKVTALFSILALIPACSWTKKDCGTCCPTTTVTTDAGTTAVEVKEEGADTKVKVAVKPGKEDLDEADLDEVMANK